MSDEQRMPMRLTRLTSASTLAVLNCFLLVGLFGIYLKVAFMARHWASVARFLGKVQPSDLTFFERLGFFFNDIVLNVLIVPVVATALVVVLFRAWRVTAALAVSVAVSLYYFMNLRGDTEVGQYVAGDQIRDLVGWAIANPGGGADYVTRASVLKLALFFGVLATVAGMARLAAHGNATRARVCRWLLLAPALAVMGGGLALASVSHAFRLPGSSLDVSAVSRAVATLAGGSSHAARLSTFEEALDRSRELTRTPGIDPGNGMVGRERGSDLIVFMMETGPARALDLAAEGRRLPGVGPLYGRAFVAEQHYTTNPYSSDAMYSFLSGMYPLGRRPRLRHARPASLDGLMTGLQQVVPVRRVYLPSLYKIESDDRMYAAFGAETVYVADQHRSDPFGTKAQQRADALLVDLERPGSRFDEASRTRLHARLRADFQALEKMKADVSSAVRDGRRYAVMFFPEIGHAPWLPLQGEESTYRRGRAVMLLQDAWIQEIVAMITALGRLEHTVIAVTADHGVRTRVEDPALPIGRISQYMFHVPLLVYAPQTLRQTVRISAPTSHIDFAPTLLSLLGRPENSARMQGTAVWQRSGVDRIYVLASQYGGVDGFTEQGTYYMRQALSGAVYRSDRFAFGDDDQARPGDPVIPFVNRALEELAEVQQTLVAVAPAGPPTRP